MLTVVSEIAEDQSFDRGEAFIKRRLAKAIERNDQKTIRRLTLWLNMLLNGYIPSHHRRRA